VIFAPILSIDELNWLWL